MLQGSGVDDMNDVIWIRFVVLALYLCNKNLCAVVF